jgi:hypothetical protein
VNVQYDINGYCNFTIVLSILILPMMDFVSGSEAMFADLCYFSVRSVQVKTRDSVMVTGSDILYVSFDML